MLKTNQEFQNFYTTVLYVNGYKKQYIQKIYVNTYKI